MQIDPDSWEEWKAHPITEALFKAFLVWAADEQQKWVAASWVNGEANPTTLCVHRSRAQMLEQLEQMTAEKIEEAHEQNR